MIYIIINYAKFSIVLLIFIKNHQKKQMDEQLRKLLLIGGLIGASYYAYNRYSRQTLGLKQTRKILQEIKHQILIVTINYCEGTRETLVKIRATNPDKEQQAFDFFREKVAAIYNQKQQLILGKHDIPKEKFAQSLQYYKNDSKIKAAQDQIIEMLDRTVRGQAPNLDVDARVTKAFSKARMVQIYQDMSKMILENIIIKFQNEERINPNFDSNNEDHFKKAIKELNIYDKKVEFFKTKGFNQQWGCPNENFFKLSESLKAKDPEFKEQMKRLQKIYEEIVDVVTKNPSAINVSRLDAFYIRAPQPSRDLAQKPTTENRFINLNSSTKSDPEADSYEKAPVFTKIQNKTVVPEKHSVEKQQINGDDYMPSDAHQLQKLTHNIHQNKQNEQKKQQSIQKGQSKDSNVSLDGGSSEPIKQEINSLNQTEENKIEENKVVPEKVETQELVQQVEQKKVQQEKVEQAKVQQVKVQQSRVEQEKIEQAKVQQVKVQQSKVEQEKIQEVKAQEVKAEQEKIAEVQKAEEVHQDQAVEQKEATLQKVPDQTITKVEQVQKVEQNHVQPTEQNKVQEPKKQEETETITEN